MAESIISLFYLFGHDIISDIFSRNARGLIPVEMIETPVFLCYDD